MLGLIAKKAGMTLIHEGHSLVPCTIVRTGACVVSQVKTIEKDGYEAAQLAYDERKEQNTPKPLKGHFAKAGTTPKRYVAEFRDFLAEYSKGGELQLGSLITPASVFVEGEFIDVVGTSKGKGFAGVMKRHGFSGVGERTRGQQDRQRAPGAIGAGSDPSRVFRGTRMAGRAGGRRVTVRNLRIVKILEEKNLLILAGAVPGANNSYIILQK